MPLVALIHHLDGTIQPVRYIPHDQTFTYLGIDISLELNDWSKQLEKMHSKFAEANAKVYYSRANGEGAAQLLNQDAFSRLSYSFDHVSCPNSFRSKIQKLACKTVKHRGRLQSIVPYSCIMAPKDLNGYGLSNLHVTYRAEKVKFLRSIISTLDSLSRLTALECIDSINQRLHYKLDILRPDIGRVHSKSKHWTDFPAFQL